MLGRAVVIWSLCNELGCLREDPHPTHAHLAMSLELIEACRAGRAVLTHLDKSMDYRTLCDETPAHVEPGYDGMEIAL